MLPNRCSKSLTMPVIEPSLLTMLLSDFNQLACRESESEMQCFQGSDTSVTALIDRK